MKKLLTLIITATIVVAISGCDFRTHTTVYPKHGPTVVYKSSPSPTVIVQEPSPYPSSTTVIYEESAQFYCDDGVGIPYEWECDGVDDCWGGEDEYYCGGSVVIVEEYYTPEPYYSVAMTMTGISSGLTLMSMFTKCASTRHVSTTTGMTLGMLAQTAGTNNPYCPYIL